MSLFHRVTVILFFSGFCSLIYQVAWLRLLRLIFGVSTTSTAVVLAIFMGGLGFGGIVLGRRVHRGAQPLLFYGALEAGIAVSAAVTPWLVDAVRAAYLGLGGVSALGIPLATGVRVLLSVLVLGLPTFLMGGTLPAVALALERTADRGRRRMAWLYGFNTLGAVAGAVFTTFWAIEVFGTRRSLWLAALLNALLAVVAWRLARRSAAAVELDEAADGTAEATAATEPAPRESAAGLVLATAGLAGFLFFLMEIVWYRMLAPVLGGSSYTFGLILAVALLGIGAGGVLYSVGPERRRPSLAALATTCALEGLLLAVPFALGDDLAWLAAVLRELSSFGFTGLVLGWTAVTALVVLPAAVVSGYQFPLLVALLGSGRERVGAQFGLAYGWNTAGAILGSLAGGLGLLPLLTAPLLWRWSALGLVVAALALTLVGLRRPPRHRAWLPLALSLVGVVLAGQAGPSAFWRHSAIGVGRESSHVDGPNGLRDILHRERRAVVREAEGVESSVALSRYQELFLNVNGKSDGSARGDADTFVMSGLLGAAFHPQPRRILVIGLGTGITAGWLARLDDVERIDVVELEPAVVELARHFDPVNLDVLDSPKVHLRIGDGREAVLTSSEQYDVIFSQPSNPYRAGVADLFSRDFYDAILKRLATGGIFLQWLQGYEVDAEVVATAYASLAEVFPAIESWETSPSDLLLMATREPLRHDLALQRRRVAEPIFDRALRKVWGVEGLEGLYSGFVGDDRLARAIATHGRISTDDHPILEYHFVRNVGRKGLFRLSDLLDVARRLDAERPRELREAVDWLRVEELRVTHAAHGSFRFPAASPAAWRDAARQAYTDGDLEAAGRAWLRQDEPPRCALDRLLVAEVLAERGADEAAATLEPLRAEAPTEALFLEARWSWRRGAADAAVARLAEGFVRFRDDAWVDRPVVSRGFLLVREMIDADPGSADRLFAALDEPFPVLLFEEQRLLTRFQLAVRRGFAERCGTVFADYEPYPIWTEPFLEARSACYDGISHPLAGRAALDLDVFRRAAAPRLRS